MMLLVHLRVTEREAIQIQNWPMLAMAAQYRLDLASGDANRIAATEKRLTTVLGGSELSVACGFDNAGFMMARLANRALQAGRYEQAGQLLAGGIRGMRQPGEWNCYRAFQERTAKLEPEQRYQFYLGFNVTSSRGLNPWFWDPADPSRDGLCSPRPKPIPVDVYPKTVAVGWTDLLQAARDAGTLQDLSRRLLRMRREMKDAKEDTKNTLFRLMRLVQAWRGDAAGASTINLLRGLKERDPSKDLDYLTILALSANKVSRPLATEVLTEWCGRDDLLKHPNGIARLARLNAWSMEVTDKQPGLRDTKFRSVYDDTPSGHFGPVRWSAEPGAWPKLTRHSGPFEERLDWTEQVREDFSLAAVVSLQQLKRVWLRWGTLHFGFRNPYMEPGRQQPGYARKHYDEGGDFWAARVYETQGKLYSATMLAETRLTKAPETDVHIRLIRTGDQIRFEVNGEKMLELRVQGVTGPQSIGFYIPDLRSVTLTDVRVETSEPDDAEPTGDVRFTPLRVNHVGWRGQ